MQTPQESKIEDQISSTTNWYHKGLGAIQSFFIILNPFLPLLILLAIPLLLLSATSQGREIVVIVLDNFSELFSPSDDLIGIGLSIGVVVAVNLCISWFCLSHSLIIISKNEILSPDSSHKKASVMARYLLVTVSTLVFSVGLAIIFFKMGSHSSKYLLILGCIIFPVIIMIVHFSDKRTINEIITSMAQKNSKDNLYYYYYPSVVLISALTYFFSLIRPDFIWFLLIGAIILLVLVLLIGEKFRILTEVRKPNIVDAIITLVLVIILIGASLKISSSLAAFFFGYSFITILILKLDFYRLNTKYPVFTVVLMGLVLIGWLRSITTYGEVRLSSLERDQKSITIEENYKNWLADKNYPNMADSLPTPIYIISSEGGGIRSAFWTTGLLHKLDSLFPDLINRTYAFSGVSGGSVGEMFFMAMKRDTITFHKQKGGQKIWEQILGADYLAGAMAGLTIGVPVQMMLPAHVPALDRARILENDWSREYEKYTEKKTLDLSLSSFYNTTGYSVPNAFFNATQVESGKKVIISNLKLNENFEGDVDLLDTIGKSVSLKTGALMSARFPGISPTALVLDKHNKKKWGKIVDGGYYDNSGLMTALDIVKTIKAGTPDSINIKPVILFLRNGEEGNQQGISSEWTATFHAFYNSWSAKTEQTVKDMHDLAKEIGFQFISLRLPYDSDGIGSDYPLGWTLSRLTQASILQKINEIDAFRTVGIPGENYSAMERLRILEDVTAE